MFYFHYRDNFALNSLIIKTIWFSVTNYHISAILTQFVKTVEFISYFRAATNSHTYTNFNMICNFFIAGDQDLIFHSEMPNSMRLRNTFKFKSI